MVNKQESVGIGIGDIEALKAEIAAQIETLIQQKLSQSLNMPLEIQGTEREDAKL